MLVCLNCIVLVRVVQAMADIQNCTKPYKSRILSVSLPVCVRKLSTLLPLYFKPGGILCTELYGSKVSVPVTSGCIYLSCMYVVMFT